MLWGVQPRMMEIGFDLSPKVESQVDTIIQNILDQLQAWGHTLTPKAKRPEGFLEKSSWVGQTLRDGA
jgi:hypothetical protein